jgi:dTDP-4-amino-4,6-dideoxygalactose transaminase
MADPDRAAVCHLFPVVLPTIAQRDALEHHLRDHGIQTSIHYRPVHTLTAFRRRFPGVRLPRTEQFGERTLTLPLYPSMSEETVSGIVGCMPGLPSSAAVRTSA